VIYADDIMRKPIESPSEKKLQRYGTVFKGFGFNINSDKCVVMKINQMIRDMEKIIVNNHEVKG
jgi:hypothetical protein